MSRISIEILKNEAAKFVSECLSGVCFTEVTDIKIGANGAGVNSFKIHLHCPLKWRMCFRLVSWFKNLKVIKI